MRRLRVSVAPCFAAVLLLMPVQIVASQDSLATARDLYASAAYEHALAVLNRLRTSSSSEDGRSIEQYRAFCLLALGRSDEAERAIEAVVVSQPLYHPSESEVSPRLRTAFSDVRRRMLPGIIQDRYAQAKTAFDRKEYAFAAQGFKQVLDVLADQDVGNAANQPPLSDLRTLAGGFYELAAKAAAPPPAPVMPPPIIDNRPPAHVYSTDDVNVAPPLPVRQVFPPFPGRSVPPGQGVVEVVVDENGAVESATLRAPVHPAYDNLVLASAWAWHYKPAMLDGVPVKYRKMIQIVLKPTR